MITPLTEDTFASWLAEHPDCVFLGWMENCSFCEHFKPVFQSVADEADFASWSFASIQIARSGSEFKRQFMRTNLGEKAGAPCVFLFQDGKYIARHHGLISKEQLSQFIRTGAVPPSDSIKTLQQASIAELKAFWLDQLLTIERAQSTIRTIQTELNSRV